MKFEPNLNSLLIIGGFIFIFIYFNRYPPSAEQEIKALKEKNRNLEDSVLASEARQLDLEIRRTQDSITYLNDMAIAEIAYQKLANTRNNTSQIKPKHEANRVNIISLDADESIKLLARRAAAIDSLRFHRRSGK